MKVVIKPGLTGNIIATVAIGDDYLKPWDQFASKNCGDKIMQKFGYF
tara:strand:- start:484 stop:624 length:141 start_codon:yes stop_codon:yes gene_type:complete